MSDLVSVNLKDYQIGENNVWQTDYLQGFGKDFPRAVSQIDDAVGEQAVADEDVSGRPAWTR